MSAASEREEETGRHRALPHALTAQLFAQLDALAAGGEQSSDRHQKIVTLDMDMQVSIAGTGQSRVARMDAPAPVIVLSGEGKAESVLCTTQQGERVGLNIYLPDLDQVEAGALQNLLRGHFRSLISAARQDHADRRVKQLLDAMMPTDPVADVHLKLVESSLSLRNEFLERVPTLTSAEVHEHAGFPGDNTSSTTHRWRKQGKIFSVTHGGRDHYPAFQFDQAGRPKPIVKDVLALLRRDPDLTDWDVALWFAGDTGWLDGKTPIECLESDPDAVKHAATQEALMDVQ